MGDASADIMSATYRALCEHGYADLTMQRIADASGRSKAALHYHYDTKEELLNAFLDDMLDQFEARLACESADPAERLGTFLDAVFDPAAEVTGEFPVALLEIKAQAPYHEPYRTRLREMDERMRELLEATVAEGVESGAFADCDPETVARFVVTLINGSHARNVALGEAPEQGRTLVEAYLERTLGVSA
ncbi:TetR/AcrR family transcriptional regulator [Halorarius litoreus]|uniref:TetR/AcrR family transcriptional regulator n=1 Tax=Halorarius litoreus TaxID=2962676 RepID=UPI0020CD159D|nr:TetR/AcrR family transcriptional regulator [Halorarius litoreus]